MKETKDEIDKLINEHKAKNSNLEINKIIYPEL